MRSERGRGGRGALGVWLIGARGGLATTVVVGAKAIARDLTSTTGMLTETEPFADLALPPLGSLVFGGHETRASSIVEAAEEIQRDSGAIPHHLIQALKPALRAVDREIRPGNLHGSGTSIRKVCAGHALPDDLSQAEVLDRIKADLETFRRRRRLRQVVVVNLASTEPTRKPLACLAGLPALRRALGSRRPPRLSPSTLYALAALETGCAFINFTPSPGATAPALVELAAEKGLPTMGNDGKTGETLVKSALAPMFKYRNLQVLSWQGYNILGDRDGAVLSDAANRSAKVATKDALLPAILGYPLHTHVGIDYVPSLGDLKTAWDFIHFKGFLDHRMSMQFSWHGCDATLAAPLVLDMVRLASLALTDGDGGLMPWLSIYFKKPMGVEEHDLHRQWHLLEDYLARKRS